MLTNLLKSVNSRLQARYTYELTRQFCSLKENIAGRLATKEEEDSYRIEANLFDQSSIKYEPVSAEEVLRKNRKLKPYKHATIGDSKPKSFKVNTERVAKSYHQPTVAATKKHRVERESESRVINDQELGFEYIRLSLADPRMSTMLITARSKKRRDRDREIIIEGWRLILEAFECGLYLKTIIFSQKDQIVDIKEKVAKALKENKNSKIYKVPQHDLKTWSSLVTPPGIMAIFERPHIQHILDKLSGDTVQTLPITVICDNIREPNNLGSIIRTCAALPCFQIVLTKGCCDPWDSKALRGGCGGHFRVPIRGDVEWDDIMLTIPQELANDCYVFVAENNLKKIQNQTNVMDYSAVRNAGAHNVVLIGGESHGVSEEAYRFMATVGDKGKFLNIPLAEGIDSLNVASALTLILYELRKSLLKTQNGPNEHMEPCKKY